MLCRHLSGEWSSNEQYSYGWFVPFFAAYLFWLRWEDRPAAETPAPEARNLAMWLIAAPALLLLLPIRLSEVGAPEWRLLGWLHAAVVVSVTLVMVWLAGGRPWLRHFAFPVTFIFVAVPWFIYLEGGTTSNLMRIVASIAAEAAALLGIPAQLEGRLIRLSTGVVGVNEACSGVRSLQTSLMIGLLFGELKRLDVMRRIVLVTGAAAIAMVANVCRTIFLVWIASSRGIGAVDEWHDTAGYVILGLVFAGSVGLAASLGKAATPRASAPSTSEARPPAASSRTTAGWPAMRAAFVSMIAFLLLAEVAVEAWYRSAEGDAAQRVKWTVRWPENAPGFTEVPVEGFDPILQFDEGRGAIWQPRDGSPAGAQRDARPSLSYLLYLFRWEPGRGSVLRARTHQPDRCLPNAGWSKVADHGVRNNVVDGVALPFRHLEFSRTATKAGTEQFAHAFHCVAGDTLKAGQPEQLREADGAPGQKSAASQFLAAIRQRERGRGQQVMQVVMVSAAQVPAPEAQKRLASLLRDSVVAVSASPATASSH